MVDQQRALRFAKAVPLRRITARSLLQKRQADIVRITEDALLLYVPAAALHVLCADSGAAALSIMQGVTGCTLLMNERTEADEALMQALGFSERSLCYNVVYEHKTPIDLTTDVRLAPLPLSLLDVVTAHYTLISRDEVAHHMQDGTLLGGWQGDTLVGFIGTHSEGSMGMLYIFPEHRRKQLGYTLEALLINRQLAAGVIPYAQIFTDNVASLALQKKLGLTQCAETISWMY